MIVPHNLLDPGNFTAVRRPALEAETLPAWCYTSKEWFDLEMARIIRPAWGYIGHTNRVPSAGDYLAFDYAGHPLIVVRGRDGQVRAFANTCRHRGVELVVKGEGNLRGAIKCQYHGWVYGLDGALSGAAGMEETKNFDRRNYGLARVRLETLGEFMFVNPSGDAPSLKEWLGGLWDELQAYDPNGLVVTRRRSYDLDCNWKVLVENFNDEGHIRTVHKSSLLDITEKYAAPALYESGPGHWLTSFCEHTGTRTLIGGVDGPKGFEALPSLRGRYVHGSYHPTIYPHACFGFCIDGGWALEVLPIAANKTKLTVNVFFHKDALARPDFADVAQRYYHRFNVSTDEDNVIHEALQRGYDSPECRPGRLGIEEAGINQLQNWWLDRIFIGPVKDSRSDARAA
ncbi:MAG: aromatic ring-hydroxylating oxygenase subunit alpha [Alphaproteobacteria bacterium]